MLWLKKYERFYGWFGLGFLLLSTLVWSISSARIQQGNSDQLVSGYLFENGRTVSGATFPASHTQLIKWPLFALLRLFDFSNSSFIVFTALLSLATVAGLAYILYRINPKPLAFGSICLALASVLALIPAQIYNGVTAPLNIAMLSNRNLEYPIFIDILLVCAKITGFKSWRFLLAAGLLGLLTASDHLFFLMSLGGGAGLLVTAWPTNIRLQILAKYWLAVSLLAWPIGALIQATVGRTTHIFNDAPAYGLSKNWHSLQPAVTGTARAVGLNFGISGQAGRLAILPLLFNALVLGAVLFAGFRLIKRSIKSNQQLSLAATLSVMLAAISLITILAFVVSNQPYLDNARYLSIVLFSGFFILATHGRQINFNQRFLLSAGSIAVLATTLSLAATWRHTNHVLASDSTRQQNARIAAALRSHHEQYLVGNYWRVFPVRLLSKNNQAVVPLKGCYSPTRVLTSDVWRPDLRTHSFAYILSLRSLGITSPQCLMPLINLRYGPPSSQLVIAGSQAHPAELLLFYDNGALDR